MVGSVEGAVQNWCNLFTEFINSNSSSSGLRALSAAKAVVYGLFLPQVIDDQVNGTGKLVCMRGQQKKHLFKVNHGDPYTDTSI